MPAYLRRGWVAWQSPLTTLTVSSLKATASLVVWGCQARHLTGASAQERVGENSSIISWADSRRWG